MIIIAGHEIVDAKDRNDCVAAYRDMVSRAASSTGMFTSPSRLTPWTLDGSTRSRCGERRACQMFCLRREVLLVRAEVRDLCRLPVAAGGWS
jgi:hypothetical protein